MRIQDKVMVNAQKKILKASETNFENEININSESNSN